MQPLTKISKREDIEVCAANRFAIVIKKEDRDSQYWCEICGKTIENGHLLASVKSINNYTSANEILMNSDDTLLTTHPQCFRNLINRMLETKIIQPFTV